MRFPVRCVLGAVLATGLCLGLAPAPAAASEDLCLRGAKSGPLPITHLFDREVMDQRNAAFNAVDWSGDPSAIGALDRPEAPALAAGYAAWSARLPEPLRDLPYLLILREIEMYPDSAPFTLTYGAESHMAARLLDAMDRAGLAAEATLYREAIGLYPDWGDDPGDRAAQIYDGSGNFISQALYDDLAGLARRWPAPVPTARAAAAAEALVASDPAVARDYAARLAAVSETDRLNWLMSQLWAKCTIYLSTADEVESSILGAGAVQAALMMMDAFMYETGEGTLDYYFYSPNGTMAPHLATLLERRGLDAEAQALRGAMALFGPVYPRESSDREGLLDAMGPDAYVRLDGFYQQMNTARVADEMLVMARDAGLLPR